MNSVGTTVEGARTVVPTSAAELSAIVQDAHRSRQLVKVSRGATASKVLRLDLSKLNNIEAYEPGDLTIRVQAGSRISDLLSALAQHGQMLPFDVPQAEQGTVGGLLASGAHGPLAAHFGFVRDYCIGIEFVTGDGVLARAGGMVVKNVAGYDLMKLLIGSRGTLGVITSANFKVFPAPKSTLTFVCRFSGWREAASAALKIRRSALHPLRLEIASPGVLPDIREWAVLVTTAGSPAVMGRFRKELQPLAAEIIEMTDAAEQELWTRLQDAGSHSAFAVEAWTTARGVNQLLEKVAASVASGGVHLTGRIGLRNLNLFAQDASDIPLDGSSEDLQWISRKPKAPVINAKQHWMMKIKNTFDPNGILNPEAVSV